MAGQAMPDCRSSGPHGRYQRQLARRAPHRQEEGHRTPSKMQDLAGSSRGRQGRQSRRGKRRRKERCPETSRERGACAQNAKACRAVGRGPPGRRRGDPSSDVPDPPARRRLGQEGHCVLPAPGAAGFRAADSDHVGNAVLAGLRWRAVQPASAGGPEACVLGGGCAAAQQLLRPARSKQDGRQGGDEKTQGAQGWRRIRSEPRVRRPGHRDLALVPVDLRRRGGGPRLRRGRELLVGGPRGRLRRESPRGRDVGVLQNVLQGRQVQQSVPLFR
mmetsp:Transcript_44532/g.127638  ORF Transcript_44532/g.127638 Transcript_44532/m.127638 type:complete len:274 (+) Transcript_44532:858-1679(+)